ncbi:MAG: phosphatase PAP2 family protein [Ignavibacteriales bacterium]|nr:phosphatase PAP2 family protein [Ignavibacteriales bacterium]
MRHRIIFSLLVLIICESSLVSQNLASRDIVQGNSALRDSAERNKYNFSQFGHETWSFIKQPTKWDGSDWLKLGLIGGGAFLAMQADQPIRDAVQKDQKYYKSVPIELGKMWADIYPPVLLFGGFAVHSLLTDDIGTRKIACEIAQALLYAGAADKLLAIVVGRARPYANEGSRSFHLFSSFFPKPEYQSLPGGHNVIAFALSTVLSRNAGPLWLKVAAYVPAGLTFVSRVYQDRHWTSDNVLGASLGYFVAAWVVDLHEREDSRIQVSSVFPLTISIALN